MKLKQKLLSAVIASALDMEGKRGTMYQDLRACANDALAQEGPEGAAEGFNAYLVPLRAALKEKGFKASSIDTYASKMNKLMANGTAVPESSTDLFKLTASKRGAGKRKEGSKDAAPGPVAEGVKVAGVTAANVHKAMAALEALYAADPGVAEAVAARWARDAEAALALLAKPAKPEAKPTPKKKAV